MGISVAKIGSAIRNTGIAKEAIGIKTAFNAGRRLARINQQSIISGFAKGTKQVYKRVGVLPIITGAAAFVGVPAPGASTAGVITGIYLKKGIEALIKVIKR